MEMALPRAKLRQFEAHDLFVEALPLFYLFLAQAVDMGSLMVVLTVANS